MLSVRQVNYFHMYYKHVSFTSFETCKMYQTNQIRMATEQFSKACQVLFYTSILRINHSVHFCCKWGKLDSIQQDPLNLTAKNNTGKKIVVRVVHTLSDFISQKSIETPVIDIRRPLKP